MGDIFVTGHRNPDTDSIVAAIAYANLRNSMGDREYRAARIGAVNDETQKLLDRFGFEPPMLVKTMRTQVQDLDFDRPPMLHRSVTMDLAWRTLRENHLTAVPITNEDGTLFDMLSAGDIAGYDIETINSNRIEDVPLFNLLSVLEGSLPGVRNYNISAKKQGGKLVFLRKILPGATDESYGIEVAKLAGVPEAVIRAASAHLKELTAQGAAPAAVPMAADDGQVTLTDVGGSALIERLRGIDPDSLSPREALTLLYELKKEADTHI